MKPKKKESSDCAIVVSSCDFFQDVWPGFFALLFRYWADCPFPVYLISNTVTYPDKRVKTLLVGKDLGWATNTKLALEKISERYVVFMLEDCYLQKKVDTAHMLRLIEFMKQNHAATVRLLPSPAPDEIFPNDLHVGRISTNAEYRVSLSPGIWDRKIFHELIVEGENPWKMEMEGTIRSRALQEAFYSATEPIFSYPSGGSIVRGKWTWEGVLLCWSRGIGINPWKRGIDHGHAWRLLKDRFRKSTKSFLGYKNA